MNCHPVLREENPFSYNTEQPKKTHVLYTEIEKSSACEMEMVAAVFIAIAAAATAMAMAMAAMAMAMAPQRREKFSFFLTSLALNFSAEEEKHFGLQGDPVNQKVCGVVEGEWRSRSRYCVACRKF